MAGFLTDFIPFERGRVREGPAWALAVPLKLALRVGDERVPG
jgi:hypothetical protein